jgi:hypothetical protein
MSNARSSFKTKEVNGLEEELITIALRALFSLKAWEKTTKVEAKIIIEIVKRKPLPEKQKKGKLKPGLLGTAFEKEQTGRINPRLFRAVLQKEKNAEPKPDFFRVISATPQCAQHKKIRRGYY